MRIGDNMTEYVYKGKKRLTEEEAKRRKAENTKFQGERMKRELAEIKKAKKTVPYTEEEKKEKRLAEHEANRKRLLEKISNNRPAIPFSEMLRKIERVGREKVALDLDFPVYFIHSWKLFSQGDTVNGWKPRDRLMIQLQDYLRNVKN